eukprot:gene2846-29540_t
MYGTPPPPQSAAAAAAAAMAMPVPPQAEPRLQLQRQQLRSQQPHPPPPLSAGVASLPFKQRFILASFGFDQLSWTTVKLYEGCSERETVLMCRRRVAESKPRPIHPRHQPHPHNRNRGTDSADADVGAPPHGRMMMERPPLADDDGGGGDEGSGVDSRQGQRCQLWGLTVCQESGQILEASTWREPRTNALQRHYGSDRLLRVRVGRPPVGSGSPGGDGGTMPQKRQQFVGGIGSNYTSSRAGNIAANASSTAQGRHASRLDDGTAAACSEQSSSWFCKETGEVYFAGRRYQYLAHKSAQQRSNEGGGYVGWFFATESSSSADAASGFLPVSIPEVWEWVGGESMAMAVRPPSKLNARLQLALSTSAPHFEVEQHNVQMIDDVTSTEHGQ